jgi:hypothetical protein
MGPFSLVQNRSFGKIERTMNPNQNRTNHELEIERVGIESVINRRAPARYDRKAQQNPSLCPLHCCRAATTHPEHQRLDTEEDRVLSPLSEQKSKPGNPWSELAPSPKVEDWNSLLRTAIRLLLPPVDNLGEFYALRRPCRASSHHEPIPEACVSERSGKLTGVPPPEHHHLAGTLSAIHFLISGSDGPRRYPFDLFIVVVDLDVNGPR